MAERSGKQSSGGEKYGVASQTCATLAASKSGRRSRIAAGMIVGAPPLSEGRREVLRTRAALEIWMRAPADCGSRHDVVARPLVSSKRVGARPSEQRAGPSEAREHATNRRRRSRPQERLAAWAWSSSERQSCWGGCGRFATCAISHRASPRPSRRTTTLRWSSITCCSCGSVTGQRSRALPTRCWPARWARRLAHPPRADLGADPAAYTLPELLQEAEPADPSLDADAKVTRRSRHRR